MTHIELAINEFVGEVIEQRGVSRWVAGARIIERLDNARTRQIAPQTIHVTGGEVPIVRRGNPAGQLLAPCRFVQVFEFSLVLKNPRRGLSSANVLHVVFRRVGDNFINRLRTFDGGSLDLLAFALRIFFQRYLREKRGHLVVLILGPALKRVIVAFVAIKTRGQKQVGGVFHFFGGRPQNFPIVGGRIAFGGS